jgi:hypothetical protein
MNQIFPTRYEFCDFSSISGYPHPVPTRDEWECSIPRFRGEKWEVPAEHLLDFHDFIDRLEIVHEDVQIKLFKFSLEGIALDWCRSLPSASVSSLADFHAAFHVFCKNHFPDDLLYPQCCHEFYLLNKDPNTHEDFAAAEDISHHDQEMGGLQDNGHSIDALNNIPNASTILDCYADQIASFKKLKNDEQIFISAYDSFESTTDPKGISQFQDLQRLEVCSRYQEEGEELNSPDQQSIVYVSPTDLEQPAFNNEISKGSFQHLFNLQLDQQSKEVLLCEFDDPFADYLESMSSIDVKIFLSEEDCFYHLFKPLFCMISLPLLFGSRSRILTVNQFMIWLHWKFDLT